MNDEPILMHAEESTGTMKESYGTISFADEVISMIAGLATVEIEGVAGMSGKLVDGITEFLGRKNFSKGIKVQVGKEDVVVDINIVVNYGISIPEVCLKIQKSVLKAVESMAGLHVTAVNIAVSGLVFKDAAIMDEPEKTTVKPIKTEKEKTVSQ